MSTSLPNDPSPDGETRPADPAETERRIGPYRVARELGHGGMGVVYLAGRADDQYRKRVAIKVLQTGMDGAEAVRHFRRERQILASLEHPGIARLLDGGSTESGHPYLVMEYVEGEVITQYCEKRNRSIAERLRLFQQVCAAVAHAHRNLVVHRDLKPANILVTAEGIPKLLDFGIAAFLNPELSGDTIGATRLALTPEYASPEQIQGGSVTTASDVYSLGVVLYELLAGVSPYRVRSRTTAEILKAVCEQEPDRPSTALTRDGEAQRAVPGADRTEGTPRQAAAGQARQRRALRGDLDTIVLKALRKEPAERYGSVEAFSDDIGRYLDGHPVSARRPTVIYRTKKFVRRNWLAASLATAAILIVVSSAITLAIQARRLERERSKSDQIATFLKDLFTIVSPDKSRGSTVTAREILDEGVKKIETTLPGDVETRADLLSTMGDVYLDLGLYAESERLIKQGLALHRQLLGEEHEFTQLDLNKLAYLLLESGRPGEAEEIAVRALAVQQRTLGDNHLTTRYAKSNLGLAYLHLGRLQDAERLLQDVLEGHSRLLGRDAEKTLAALNNLALLRERQGRRADALTINEEVLAHRRRLLGDNHPLTIASINNLAVDYIAAGRHDEARAMLLESLRLGERTFGASHPTYGILVHSLAELELAVGNLDEADARFRSALKIYQLQPGHTFLPFLLYQLAQVSAGLSKPDQSFEFLEQARQAGYWRNQDVELKKDPHLASLSNDPRLRAFEEKVRSDAALPTPR